MKKSGRITVNIVINTTQEKVWDVLFTKFGDAFLYNPNLAGSDFIKSTSGEVGCERECRLDHKTYVRERISKADFPKGFIVDITGGNMPMVKEMQVEFKFDTLSAESINVILLAAIRTQPFFMFFFMKLPFKMKLKDMLVGLKYYLETGKPVTRQSYKSIYMRFKKIKLNQSFS